MVGDEESKLIQQGSAMNLQSRPLLLWVYFHLV